MRINIPITLTAIGLLTAALALTFSGSARAQANLPFGPENYDCDLQLFAPVEIDLNDQPYHDDHGYFFHYDKVLWSFSGERALIGDPVVTAAEESFRFNPNQDLAYGGSPSDPNGTQPQPYDILNGIQDAYPDAGFATGNRFELGYTSSEGSGWVISALQGPILNQHNVFGGFGNFQPNTPLVGEGNPSGTPVLGASTPANPLTTVTSPPLDPDYTNDAGNAPGGFAGGGKAFGYGSVHVNFQAAPGALLGFSDTQNRLAGAFVGTQRGVIAYVGNYGSVAEASQNTTTIPFFHSADDNNENGIEGSNLLGTLTDFGDLRLFNIAFDRLEVHNDTRTDGVEMLGTQQLSNRHFMAKNQNNRFEALYGARYFMMYDNFRVDGFGSVLGKSYWDTTILNNIVGPEVGLRWTNQRQRWQLSADTRFTFGYNVENFRQADGMGEELIPGALNRPLFLQPTFSHYSLMKDDFSPLGELRVETSYYLTQNFSLKLGYNGMYVGNVRRAADSVRYFLPDMGFQDRGTQNLLVNGVNFGVEFVH
jgi:Putative beta barrel porin-7 (BBP7)